MTPTGPASSAAPDPYVEHRNLLFTVAYEMLGSAVDAEDVVQEVWLRWSEVDHATVRDPRSYLVQVSTRLALNRLRTLSRRRETYVGPWLPEPLMTTGDVADDVELADSVSMAMLVVLDTLGPLERAVFVLREVFGYPHRDIAEAVGRSPEAVRQLAHRAREHVRARREQTTPRRDLEKVVRLFAAAADGGDLQQLMDVLAPDVVLFTDGGGVVKAALRPITGADNVLRFSTAVLPPDASVETVDVNGSPAVVFRIGGVVDSVVSYRMAGGLVTQVYVVRNPDKLRRLRLGDPVQLTR
jgi:RNA polymerase sigma-70 factor (ECF subfamily)